jgi:tetratricopeptide (TPR) repeat protein
MDNFFDYRDPLFGIIIFLSLVLLVFCINYYFEYTKKNREYKSLDNIKESFNIDSNLLNLDKALNSFDLPFDTIVFIATAYYKNGNYDKAIYILLSLLKNEDTNSQKEQVLDLLGQIYFKAGFLEKSKNIFLKSLELYPKNKITLNNLLISYEMTKDYDKALEILVPLEELNVDVCDTKIYLETLQIIDDYSIVLSEKIDNLETILKENKFVTRLILDFFSKYSKSHFLNNINKNNEILCIDMLYYLYGNDLILESYLFELDIIKKLEVSNSNMVGLSFEYICDDCKNIYPLYQNRCPNCRKVLSMKPEAILVNNNNKHESNTF